MLKEMEDEDPRLVTLASLVSSNLLGKEVQLAAHTVKLLFARRTALPVRIRAANMGIDASDPLRGMPLTSCSRKAASSGPLVASWVNYRRGTRRAEHRPKGVTCCLG